MIIFLIVVVLVLAAALIILLNKLRKSAQWAHFEARLIQSANAEPPLRLEVAPDAPESAMAEAINKIIAKAGERQLEVEKIKQSERQWQQQQVLNKDYESLLDRLRLVGQLGQDITKGLTVSELFQKLNEVLQASFPLIMVQLGVRRGDVWQCYTQVKPSNYSEQEVSQLHPVTDWVVRHEEPLLLEDIAAHYRRFLSELPQWEGLPSAGSCLALPLASKPGVNSWLMLVTTAEFPLSEAQMEFVRALVPYVAVSLDNARIYLDLDKEKQKADTLLHNILPKEVAEELKAKGKTEARLFEHVTVLFTDFVNFTGTSERMSPHELVEELDACFKAFDLIMEKHGLEKIKTIGDAYMAVSGLPVERPDHARAAVEAAREILAYVNWRRNEGTLIFDIRIGLHTGPVVAGIVGHTKFAYDIWGDAVNVASRMENTGEVGRIQISEAVYNLVKDQILCEYRGSVAIKNKGDLITWWVDRV